MTAASHPSRRRRRIFVSYRREDAKWFAGRLADSLAAYFGDRRVFRDIEGISGGTDFASAIHDTLTDADAVIVVIGKDWLGARDAHGRRRLEQPDDWVAQEVGSALAKGVAVFPVLVEDTPMPRADELPAALRALTRFHAVSISDSRWDSDTARLGRIVSLDIAPAGERRLRAVNVTASALLVAAMVFTLSVLAWRLLASAPPAAGRPAASVLALFGDHLEQGCALRPAAPWPLESWHTAPLFVALSLASALLFRFGRDVAASSRRAYHAAAWVGGAGTLAGFLLYFFACPADEPVVTFTTGMVVALLMLALMSVSGFRAK